MIAAAVKLSQSQRKYKVCSRRKEVATKTRPAINGLDLRFLKLNSTQKYNSQSNRFSRRKSNCFGHASQLDCSNQQYVGITRNSQSIRFKIYQDWK